MTVDSQRAGDLAVLEGCLRIGFSLICAAVCVTSHTVLCLLGNVYKEFPTNSNSLCHPLQLLVT